MAAPSDDDRESGVAFGDLAEALEAHEYPADLEELLAEHGDATVGLESGDRTFAEVMEPMREADDGTTFESADEVRQAVFNLVGDEAVGRRGYTDRGGSSPVETEEAKEVEEREEEGDQSF